MKKIINGKRYDTEKATELGTASHSNRSDFRWYEETLYQTPRGKAFFLSGEGGAMTQWSRPVDGNARMGGSGIIPLTSEQALEWAERHLDADTVDEFFGDSIEDA